MCFSLKGLAYAGTAIHISSGLVDMGKFIDAFIFLTSYPKTNQTLEYWFVTLGTLLNFFVKLPLSTLIFIGVDKDYIPLLTYSPILHFLLKVFGFILQNKYGVMNITQQKLTWVKATYIIPDSVEKLTQDFFVGFICTTFHLVVIFFLVQHIEKSFRGQVIDASPGYSGYSIAFSPHPIQPPSRWFSLHSNNNHHYQHSQISRNFNFNMLRSPRDDGNVPGVDFFPNNRNNNNHNNNSTASDRSSLIDENNYPTVLRDRINIDNERPPPYYQYENTDTISTNQLSQQTFVIQQHGDENDERDLLSDTSCTLDSSRAQEQEVDVRMPLLPSTSRRKSSITINQGSNANRQVPNCSK